MSLSISLKWGTLKGWSGITKQYADVIAALERYHAEPTSMSAMGQNDTPTQKQALCDAIDAVSAAGGVIENDWEGTEMTAEEAKRYVMEYPNSAHRFTQS